MLDNTGHRQRVKDRFRKEGLEHFHEVHVLELLLFYCVPRKDTKDLARRLLDRFGSLSLVLEASLEELEQVEGVGPNISTFLKLITAVDRYYWTNRAGREVCLDDVQKYGNYLKGKFLGQRNEMVYLLCLDAQCRVLCCKKLDEGNVNSAKLSPRQVVEAALNVGATTVVLAHNHTSGLALPSMEDISTTRYLGRVLDSIGVILTDHVIVAENDFVSLAQSGYYNPRDCESYV